MIVSASRRCDIPTYYSDWFYHRIAEQYVLVRNPMNFRQVSRVILSPEVVDCMVLWTKNPAPMLTGLQKLKDYMYYFQFTLNGYGGEMETGLPSVEERVETFRRLSDILGKERVLWRYDPILFNNKYSAAWHEEEFAGLAEELAGYTEKCTISFLDRYHKIRKDMDILSVYDPSREEKSNLAAKLSAIARHHGIRMESCAEDIPLEQFGIEHGRCIDDRLIARLLGCSLNVKKDRNQRQECGCAASVDIGAYNTCMNGCRYCYANTSKDTVLINHRKNRIDSPMLCSGPSEHDTIKEYPARSLRDQQLSLF